MTEREAWEIIRRIECVEGCKVHKNDDCPCEECAYNVALGALNTIHYLKHDANVKVSDGTNERL